MPIKHLFPCHYIQQSLNHVYFPSGTTLNDTHVGTLLNILQNTSDQWENIGLYLKFLPGELAKIRSSPLLITTAPKSWLREMLVAYTKRSTANIVDLSLAVRNIGEEQLAFDLQGMFYEATIGKHEEGAPQLESA